MTVTFCESFWDYRELFKQWLGSGCAPERMAEPEVPYQADPGPMPLNERLIQTIWAQQLLQPTGLHLLDGRPLRVLDPGRWNGSAGPDFLNAQLVLGSDAVQGDVEIHLTGSDWLNHGHQRDLRYNTVVLHVILRVGADGLTQDPLHNGRQAPRLELEPYIFPDLETVRRSLTADDFQYAQPAGVGRCHAMLAGFDPALVADYLDRAGDERLLAKMQRFDEQARLNDLEQVFFQALLMALGAGSNKTLYYLLAKRAPLRELFDDLRGFAPQRQVTAFEALLLHVGGLVAPPEALAKAPPEARERVAQLQAFWAPFVPYWQDRLIPPTRRWFLGLRPVNFPVRRLAGISVLLARALSEGRWPLAELLERLRQARPALAQARPTRRRHPVLTDLVAQFVVSGEGHFWGNHYSFAAQPAARTMDLIGEGAALSLVLNALLPVALLAARRANDEALADSVRRLYALMPPLQANHITEFMTRRLFGEDEQAQALINTERRRQGLFQIFYACCNGEERHCDQCYFLAGMRGHDRQS